MAPGSPCGSAARPLAGLPNPPCLQASLFYARNHRFLSCPSQTSNFTETHQCASFSFFQALGGGCKENNREQQLTPQPPEGKTLRVHAYTQKHGHTQVYSLKRVGQWLHVTWGSRRTFIEMDSSLGVLTTANA